MAERPDAEQPPEESGPATPPYPGWSVDQPPRRDDWAPPGTQGTGWSTPEQGPGRTSQQGAGEPPAGGGGQPGWQQPGGEPPGAPDAGPPGEGPGRPSGWSTDPTWGWSVPPVKPGVIPLRPLAVGEILDGAVTTIRQNIGSMLGLSAVVATLVQLLGFGVNVVFVRDLGRLENLPTTATTGQVLDAMAATLGGSLVVLVLTWLATVILTGILTVVVGRAVLGERLRVSEAWALAKPRLLRLLLLTLALVLIVISPFLVTALLGLLFAVAGAGEGAAVLVGLLMVVAVPVAVWLYIRYVLSVPTIMLESTSERGAHGGRRPIGVVGSLRRSAELVRHSWWRTFGILLLVLIIVTIVANVIGVVFSIPYMFVADPFDPSGAATLATLALSSLGAIVGTTITAPFSAGATALLYVDRRIRREGLDIELARAAGVTLPGRTDTPGPPPPVQ